MQTNKNVIDSLCKDDKATPKKCHGLSFCLGGPDGNDPA